MGYKWSNEDLITNIPLVTSFSELCTSLGLSRSCSSALKQKAVELSLDFSHFRKSGIKPKCNLLRSNTHRTKLNLIKLGIFEPKCYACNLTTWQNVNIPLELDHIDGNKRNNDLSNLTLLCPNCHALTSTYRAKNRGKYSKPV